MGVHHVWPWREQLVFPKLDRAGVQVKNAHLRREFDRRRAGRKWRDARVAMAAATAATAAAVAVATSTTASAASATTATFAGLTCAAAALAAAGLAAAAATARAIGAGSDEADHKRARRLDVAAPLVGQERYERVRPLEGMEQRQQREGGGPEPPLVGGDDGKALLRDEQADGEDDGRGAQPAEEREEAHAELGWRCLDGRTQAQRPPQLPAQPDSQLDARHGHRQLEQRASDGGGLGGPGQNGAVQGVEGDVQLLQQRVAREEADRTRLPFAAAAAAVAFVGRGHNVQGAAGNKEAGSVFNRE